MNWIRSTESLPKNTDMVVIYDQYKYDIYLAYFCEKTSYKIATNDGEKEYNPEVCFVSLDNEKIAEICDHIYYYPLPEVPK